jgi:regulation of enolase protein 1 (concanavalin A-like superfamily)
MTPGRRIRTVRAVAVAVALVATAATWAHAAPVSLTSANLTVDLVSPPCLPPWWDGSYGYRAQVTVTTGAAPVSTDYSVSITLDHAALVTAGSSLAGGDDVRVVALDSATCTWTELDRVLDDSSSWNSSLTRLWFRLAAAIGPDSSSPVAYFVYYGNPGAGPAPADAMNVFLFFDDFPGTSLGPDWTVLRPPGTWSVSGGALHITTPSNKDFWGGTNNAPLFSIPSPAGDLEVQVEQAGSLNRGGHTGVLGYQDDNNYVAQYHEVFSGGCRCEGVEMVREVAGSPTSTPIEGPGSNPMHVRLTKLGTQYSGAYSTDGVTYTTVDSITSPISQTTVGVTAFNSTWRSTSVDLTHFRVRRYTAPEPSTSLGAPTAQY